MVSAGTGLKRQHTKTLKRDYTFDRKMRKRAAHCSVQQRNHDFYLFRSVFSFSRENQREKMSERMTSKVYNLKKYITYEVDVQGCVQVLRVRRIRFDSVVQFVRGRKNCRTPR